MMGLLRFVRTARYIRKRQLVARLRLMLRRTWRERHAERYRQRMEQAPLPSLDLFVPLPMPIMPPRQNQVEVHKGAYTFCFLNEARTSELPIEWHPPEMEHGTRLWKLNLHYMEYLEALDTPAFTEVVEDWIEQNPPYRPGYWRDNWNSFSLSIRCVVWMQQYAVRCQGLNEPFRQRLLASLMRQLCFLEQNLELDIGGNHLIKNVKALLWAGRFFQGEEAARWRTKGEMLLRQELDEQILADGMHYERSPAYHGQVFVDLLECYHVLQNEALKETLQGHLKAMAQVLTDLTHPDGFCSLFNDGALEMTYLPQVILRVYHELVGEQPSPRNLFALSTAGYYGFRAGKNLFVADCGPLGPDFLTVHGHGDALAFEWSVDGQRIIIDAGIYEYNAGRRRDYARSTQAHNTLTLDGQDQSEFWGAFRVACRARANVTKYRTDSEGFVLQGYHNGYTRLPGKPIHQRTFRVGVHSIEVEDEVIGGQGQMAEARLLLHPECDVRDEPGALHIRRGKTELRLISEAAMCVEKALWFPNFGVEASTLQVTILYGEAPCKEGFSLRVRP